MDIRMIPAIIIAFTIAYFVSPLVIKLAIRIGAVDRPNDRKIHQKEMPRLGGLAIYLAFCITLLFFSPLPGWIQGLVFGSTVIVLVGVLDDTRGLSPKIKLLGQLIAALVAVYFGIKVQFVTNPINGMLELGRLTIPVTLLWIVGVTNAVNLVDGLDGLAAGISAIAALTMGVIAFLEGQIMVAFLAFVFCSAILGFLKYNFHPARVFMGDTGSMFLGFTLSILAIEGLTKSATVISLFIPIVILGIPIFDTAFAIIRRLFKGNSIFHADKEHLHHRLLEIGLSHKQTVVTIYIVSAFLSGSAVLLTLLTTEQSIWILIGLTTISILAVNKIGVKSTKEKVGRPVTKRHFRDYGG